MCTLKQVSARRLADRSERAKARLAEKARFDCVFGGARASVLAQRLESMGSTEDYDRIVADAYTSSDGCARDYLAYECPECGQVRLGESEARACCYFDSNDSDWDSDSDA